MIQKFPNFSHPEPVNIIGVKIKKEKEFLDKLGKHFKIEINSENTMIDSLKTKIQTVSKIDSKELKEQTQEIKKPNINKFKSDIFVKSPDIPKYNIQKEYDEFLRRQLEEKHYRILKEKNNELRIEENIVKDDQKKYKDMVRKDVERKETIKNNLKAHFNLEAQIQYLKKVS